ncbi:MAG: hypothetical protein DCC67_00685 [Planctomycetota bacterium]|nr:MAG: hypothetical protein DCC67_00685 [Planctomycetota bacterium]
MAVSFFQKLVAAASLACGLMATSAAAQDAGGPAGEPPSIAAAAVPATGAASAAGPDVFLLPDATGKLRRVLGYRYEDFLKAWQAGDDGEAEVAPPQYSVERLAVEATAGPELAEVEATATVELHTSAWVEVPLGFGPLITESATISDGSEQEFVRFDAARNTYAAWLQGKPGDKRTIVMAGRLALERQGDVRRLAVDLPTAVASTVRVAASSLPVVESPEGVLATPAADDEGGQVLQIEGAKGRLVLRWGEAAPELAGSDEPALEATVETIASVEPGRLWYEAWLKLSGADQPIERVHLRLPAGAVASAPPDTTDYELVPIVKPTAAEPQSIVELRLVQPATQPPVFRPTGGSNALLRRNSPKRCGGRRPWPRLPFPAAAGMSTSIRSRGSERFA